MAVSFIANLSSAAYYPTSNPITFTVNSNNTGNCNFRYINDIYVNGVKVFTQKQFPDTTTGYGFFDISQIVNDYINGTIPKSPYTDYFNTTSNTDLLTVYCKLGEEYDSSVHCDGTIYTYLNQVQTNTIYAFQGAIDYEDYPSCIYSNYLITTSSSTTKKFLTNSPRTLDITDKDSFYLDFLSNETIDSNWDVYLTINWKNGSTSQLALTSGSLTQYRKYRIAVGPFDINKIYGSTLLDSSLVNTYSVYLRYSTVRVSETFTFKMKAAKPYETRFAWTNQLGGIDHFTFYHRNTKSYNITRKTYKKSLLRNYSNYWTYQVGDREQATYNISAKQTNKVSTFCGRTESEWLSELWFSPNAWIYDYVEDTPCNTITTWKMWPIIITDDSKEVKQKMTKPIEYNITYEMAFGKNLIK